MRCFRSISRTARYTTSGYLLFHGVAALHTVLQGRLDVDNPLKCSKGVLYYYYLFGRYHDAGGSHVHSDSIEFVKNLSLAFFFGILLSSSPLSIAEPSAASYRARVCVNQTR